MTSSSNSPQDRKPDAAQAHDMPTSAGPGPRRPQVATILVIVLVAVVVVTAALLVPRMLPAASSSSCVNDRLDGFFDTRSATEQEVEFQNRLDGYAASLAEFGCERGTEPSGAADPVEGSWIGDEGLFTFNDGVFRWSIALDGDEREYYFSGRYTWLPGCEFEGDLQTDRSGSPCRTVFLRYEKTMSADVLSEELYYGGLMIAQTGVGQSSEQISVFNMRTGGSFYLDKLQQ